MRRPALQLLIALTSWCAVLASPLRAQLVEPPLAADLNPDPQIVEVALQAGHTTKEYLPGIATRVAAYNGTVPGPTLVANVGDTLVVHFTNNLPGETTIHWHGVETPAQMDGSHIAQKPVPGGGGTFRYEFRLLTAGMFWYHPHVRTKEAVEAGLYGAILVRDPQGEAGLDLPTRERVVIFDDVLLDDDGQIATHEPDDPLVKVAQLLNGRSGNHQLINGQVVPQTFAPDNGVPERWRVLNAANTRFLRLSFEDSRTGQLQIVFRIGGDGGLLETPILKPKVHIDHPELDAYAHVSSQDPEEGIFLTPGERADMVWTPNAALGERIGIRNHEWNRGAHTVMHHPDGSGKIILGDDEVDGFGRPVVLLQAEPVGSPGAPYVPPFALRDIEPIDPAAVRGTLQLTMGHSLPPFAPDGSDAKLFIQAGTPMAALTSLEAYDVEVGGTYVWEVKNLTHMDHPFHTHGWTFQPFELEYQHVSDPELNFTVPLTQLENKDTFRVPGRVDPMPMSGSVTLRAYVRFGDEGREGQVVAEGLHPADDVSGGWLAHCHILEHAAGGMMTFFEVREPDHTSALLGFGSPGVAGVPELRLDGAFTPGSATSLRMSHGAPDATSALFVGSSTAATPFLGGVLLPSPGVVLPLLNDDRGRLDERFHWPVGLPAGQALYWQVWSQDLAGVAGHAASNAVMTLGG